VGSLNQPTITVERRDTSERETDRSSRSPAHIQTGQSPQHGSIAPDRVVAVSARGVFVSSEKNQGIDGIEPMEGDLLTTALALHGFSAWAMVTL
jgi:hypothetical protein